jgi:oligo-1,6-glucosidase
MVERRCLHQIYLCSFSSNNSGWADIRGILSKLPYLLSLGIDVLWLSPVYASPQKDNGYDVSDYEAVHPRYRTLEDMQELIETCHKSGMKVILDLVVNHTSDPHAWFRESRQDTQSEKRDWYFWRPARYDDFGQRMPPTNWRSYRGCSAWTWDEQTEEYYLHIYDASQSDLNWEKADCRAAIYDSAMRFWLDRGVDGYRIDTVNKYSKVSPFVDVPELDERCSVLAADRMWCNGPRMHEFTREMKAVLSTYRTHDSLPVVAVGELAMCSDPTAVLPYISLTGSLFLYQGQEIGMVNAPKSWDIGVGYKDPVSQSLGCCCCGAGGEEARTQA